MSGQSRYQNPYLPNGGNPGDLNIAVASFRFIGMLGTIHTAQYLDADGVKRRKTFMLVKTNATLTAAPFDGCIAYWSAQDSYEVSTALVRGRPAGVFVNVPGVSSVCMIQILGRHPGVKYLASTTAAPSAAGLHVIPSATVTEVDCLAAGTAATYPLLGLSVGTASAQFGPVQLTVGAAYL